MEKPVDLFCSTLNNLARFTQERQELFLPSRSSMPLVLQQETLGFAICGGEGIGKPAAPTEGPRSSALNKCCSCLGGALPFCCSWVFLRWQRWVLSCEVGNPGQSQRKKGLLINSETCWTSTSGKVRDAIINGSTGKKESETQVLANKYTHKYS